MKALLNRSARHQRPDALAGLKIPSTLGRPSWYPTSAGEVTPAQARALERAAQARLECARAQDAWFRFALPDRDFRESIRDLREAEREAATR